MEKPIEFNVGPYTLRGTLISPLGDGPFPGVIFFHGSKFGNRDKGVLAGRELVNKGIISLSFEFRGHGESSGLFEEAALADFVEDGQAAINFLKKHDLDETRLGLKGSSLGAYVASVLAINNEIKSLMLNVPAAFVDESLTIHKSDRKGRKYMNSRKNWERSRAYEGIRRFRGSILVVRNEFDELLSKEMVEHFYHEANNSRKRELFVLKGARHSTWNNPEAMALQHKMTVEWFSKTL